MYHEGNLSKMPDLDVFPLLEFRKRTARSHGIKKNGNCKRKSRVQKLANCTLRDLAAKLDVHGRHCMLSYLSSLLISVLRSLDTEANKFYDRTNRLYDAALLTRCYTQHVLRPSNDSKINHIRHFIEIPFINKGMDFIDLPSIFRDKSVQSAIPNYFKNYEVPSICYKYNKSRKENPQKRTQLSSRSHPRHLVGKGTAQKDITIDTTSDSQVNSNFPNRWSPASLTFNNYFYLFLYLNIT